MGDDGRAAGDGGERRGDQPAGAALGGGQGHPAGLQQRQQVARLVQGSLRQHQSSPSGRAARASRTSAAASAPVITSSSMTPSAPYCRSAQPTGPGLVISKRRNSRKASSTP